MTERLSVKAGKENRNYRKISADRGADEYDRAGSQAVSGGDPHVGVEEEQPSGYQGFSGKDGKSGQGDGDHSRGRDQWERFCVFLPFFHPDTGRVPYGGFYLPPSDLCKRAVPSQWQAGRGKGVSRRV